MNVGTSNIYGKKVGREAYVRLQNQSMDKTNDSDS